MAPALLAFFTIFFVTALVLPTWRIWKRDRVNALVLPYDDTAQGLVAKWFRATLFAIFAVLLALCLGLSSDALGRLAWLEAALIRTAGGALLVLSLLWVVVAQAQMGASWRIGIDAGLQPSLVSRGVFGRSRNPIFLGMRGGLLGLFLTLPNAVTMAIFLLGEMLMQVQVRLEEAHLAATLGQDYASYRRSVRRWL
ncbi:isoprenylcysteine carboxylmethyltransferase family protein [Sphingomonas parva]|uniref:Isoprenylcysteine carboxylmethyltransferase family protein n=1 Tax=Sphingomonas parva TaxID=2555898 RepID=A0A4Y8ZR27_9SPHN|nr:methyltransferase [Sphingomonas parva]TFI58424.1 isoprenylcysteine carboxylmethyltransferase family protein [Sphingomonas parva]